MLADGTWDDGLCSLVAKGVCGAPTLTSHAIVVGLPGISGSITPPNAVTSPHQYGTVQYAPPVPTLSVDGGMTHSGTVTVSVTWSSPVTGLSSGDFAVSVATAARVLTGAGDTYILTVSVQPAVAACPSGFTSGGSGSARLCARVQTQAAAWDVANALCAPYSLAPILSADQNALVGSLRTYAAADRYWYASRLPWRVRVFLALTPWRCSPFVAPGLACMTSVHPQQTFAG